MSVSYRLSQEHNFQTVLWAIGGAVYHAGCAGGQAYRLLYAAMPPLLAALALLAKVLGLVACVVGCAFLALAFWVVLVKLLGGLLIVAAFGWATYPRPRKAVK